MPKARRYDTVVLLESIGAFQKGEKGAVVEVYTTHYEAYDEVPAKVRFSDGTEVTERAEELYERKG